MRYALWLLGGTFIATVIYRAVAWSSQEFPASAKRRQLSEVIGSFVSEDTRRRACLQAEEWPWL